MASSNREVHDLVAQEASEWFIANRAGPLSEAERVKFVAWLRASPLNVQEYLGVAAIARDLPVAADDPAAPLETLLAAAAGEDSNVVRLADAGAKPAARSPARPRPLRFAYALAASLLVAVATGWWLSERGGTAPSPVFQTAHGQQATWPLPDGSLLRLNSDSEIRWRESSRERRLTISRGEAFVQVAHESSRRLIVEAGDTQVVATGTEFDVYRRGLETVVTVVEGAVAVLPVALRLNPGEALPDSALRVKAHEQVRVAAGRIPATAVPVDLDTAMAWLDHQIAFKRQPLGEVAEDFNRYGAVRIEIEDPALRSLEISGVFEAGDIESFVAFVSKLEGVHVQRTSTVIRIQRDAAAPAPGRNPR